MARIKLSPFAGEISGSIGGITIQKNSYGNTMRIKPNPISSSSQSQLNQRSILKQCQYGWQALSEDQQKVWNNFNSFAAIHSNHNKDSLLSGYANFLKYNTMRLSIGLDLLNDIVFGIPVFPSTVPYLTYGGGTLNYIVYPAIDWDQYGMLVYLSPPSIRPTGIPVNSLRLIQLEHTGSATFDISSSYLSRFGRLVIDGQYVLHAYRYISVISPVVSKLYKAPTLVTSF